MAPARLHSRYSKPFVLSATVISQEVARVPPSLIAHSHAMLPLGCARTECRYASDAGQGCGHSKSSFKMWHIKVVLRTTYIVAALK